MTAKASTGYVPIGRLRLQSGQVLDDARVGYRIWGELGPEGEAVVLPSYYSGTTASYEPWVGAGDGCVLDPEKLCVIAYDQLGAGASSKPSACARPWPRTTCTDSANAARTALAALGVRRVRLVAGWSMGGMQAFQWAALFPELVDAAFALCATPGCEPVNELFLRSIRPMLLMAAEAKDAGERGAALAAFGAAYAGWAYSDELMESGGYREVGYGSIAAIVDGWGRDHRPMEAADLLAQLDCWLATEEPEAPRNGDGAVRLISMPCSSDRYFSAASTRCTKLFPNAGKRVLESDLGHIAGRPGIREAETQAVRAAVQELLACG